jgi:DNA-binding CsgD family transcriptional regulator
MVTTPLKTPLRETRRKIAVELMARANPTFDPIDELFNQPLIAIDKGGQIRSILKSQARRLLDINLTKSESALMLAMASGHSAHKIAFDHDRSVQTVWNQRKTLYRKFITKYPALDFGEYTYKTGPYDPDAVIILITLRLLNQMI